MEPIWRRDLVEDVRLQIRSAILADTLPPGGRLLEEQLADQLGVSRAPVRDALKDLEREGLVAPSGKRGKMVRLLSARDAWEVYSLRATLEAMAIRLAIARGGEVLLAELEQLLADMSQAVAARDHTHSSTLDVRFHEAICTASRHERLLDTWRGMSIQIRLLSRRVIDTQYVDMGPIATRHALLVDVIRAGDPDAAENAIRAHIDSVSARVMTALTEMERDNLPTRYGASTALASGEDTGL